MIGTAARIVFGIIIGVAVSVAVVIALCVDLFATETRPTLRARSYVRRMDGKPKAAWSTARARSLSEAHT